MLVLASLAGLMAVEPAGAAPLDPAVDRARPIASAALGPARAQEGTRLAFWAGEAVPGTKWSLPGTYWNRRDTSSYTPGLWRVLRRHHIPLYFNLRYRRDFGPVPRGRPRYDDALSIIRRANRHGVTVWAWILTPFTKGYWAWEGAAPENFEAVKALVRWAEAKRVRLRGLVLDFESPVQTTLEGTPALLGAAGTSELPSSLWEAIDPRGQCRAWRGYARIAFWAKRNGVRLAATPVATALDDLDFGGIALQDAAQFVVPDAPWHTLFFQAYRSTFTYHLGQDPGPGIIPSYFRSARRAYGTPGQVSLGSAGRGPYRRLSPLVHDIRVAATMGARQVPIYSLERTLRAYGGPRSVVTLAEAARRPFIGRQAARAASPTPRARAIRAAIRRLDVAVTRATPSITAAAGSSRPANPWPDGCAG